MDSVARKVAELARRVKQNNYVVDPPPLQLTAAEIRSLNDFIKLWRS